MMKHCHTSKLTNPQRKKKHLLPSEQREQEREINRCHWNQVIFLNELTRVNKGQQNAIFKNFLSRVFRDIIEYMRRDPLFDLISSTKTKFGP